MLPWLDRIRRMKMQGVVAKYLLLSFLLQRGFLVEGPDILYFSNTKHVWRIGCENSPKQVWRSWKVVLIGEIFVLHGNGPDKFHSLCPCPLQQKN